jgi:hypothetical protein
MLQKQVISLSVDGNMDQLTDSKLVDPGQSLLVLNARRNKLGRLSKRFGREPMALSNSLSTIDSLKDYSPSRILSDGKTLYADTLLKNMFAYSEASQRWESVSGLTDSCFVKSQFTSKDGANQKFPDNDFDQGSSLLVTSYLQDNGQGIFPSVRAMFHDLVSDIKKDLQVAEVSTDTHPRTQIINHNGKIYPCISYWDNSLNKIVSAVYNKLGEVEEVFNFSGSSTFETVKLGNRQYIVSISGSSLSVFYHEQAVVSGALTPVALTNAFNGTSVSVAVLDGVLHICWATGDGFAVVGIDPIMDSVVVSESNRVVSNDHLQSLKRISIIDGVSEFGSGLCVVASSGNTVDDYTTDVFNINPINYTLNSTHKYYRMGVISAPLNLNEKFFIPLGCLQEGIKSGYLAHGDNNACYFSRENLSELPGLADSNYMVPRSPKVGSEHCVIPHQKIFKFGSPSATLFERTASIAIANTFFDFQRDYRSGSTFKIGENLHLVSGKFMELDGRRVFENNFPLIPSGITATEGDSGGSVSPGAYTYRVVLEYYDGNGQITRSRPSPVIPVTVSTGKNNVRLNLPQTYLTDKGIEPDTKIVAVAYRTKVGGSGPLYRTAENKMNVIVIAINGYAIYDQNSDSTIADNEILYTDGGVLDNDPAPIARFGCSGGSRVFLGGLENPREIAYSKKVLYGESVSFSDFFRIQMPAEPTALGYMDDKLIIFNDGIRFVSGDGPLETGQNDTFTEPQLISSDSTCDEPRSVINIPQGLMYKSSKGIYLLNRNLATEYIGAGVDDYKHERVLASYLLNELNEVRFLTDGGHVLTYNYLQGKWHVSDGAGALDATEFKGREAILIDGAPYLEKDNRFTDFAPYSLKYVTPWLKFGLVQGLMRIWKVLLLGDYKSPHTLNVRAYYDYDESNYDEYSYVHDPLDNVFQWRIHLKRQKCQAMKLEIFDTGQSGSGESFSLTNIQIEAGVKKGSAKLGASKTN